MIWRRFSTVFSACRRRHHPDDVSLNPLSAATIGLGTLLWIVTLVGVVRGRGTTRRQRALTAVVLLAAPVGVLLLLR